MKRIEIVSHCFCPPGVPFYAECLKWQWSSIVTFATDCIVDYTVCYTDEDRVTKQQIAKCMKNEPENVYMRPLQLSPPQLFRRAIGRNARAIRTDADVIWMTDVDYLFGFNCLHETVRLVDREESKFCMPQSYFINIDHETGDQMLADAEHLDLPQINADLFTERKQKLAIGGLHILGGDFASKVGYLKDTDYLKPVTPQQGFRSCKCDRHFRKHIKTQCERLPLPNLFRIRHTTDGRDFSREGEKGKGKEFW